MSGSPTTSSDGRLGQRWAALRAAGRAALIPYVTAGYPDAGATAAFLRGAERAGADVVELGIPWSDPVADGPVIQASTHAALEGGMTLSRALALLAEARTGLPVVVFSYLNPILADGPARFARAARAAGAAGVLAVDLPVDSDPAVEGALRSSGLPLVRLAAPTTTPQRLRRIAAVSEGFLYLLARVGVTGASATVPGELAARVAAARACTNLPIAVGFGISSAAQAADVARLADGVVVGSAVVERLGQGGAEPALRWLAELRTAMDAPRSAA